jgi:hypothetical protein
MLNQKKEHRSRMVVRDVDGNEREPYKDGFNPNTFGLSESNLSYLENRKLFSMYVNEMDQGVLSYWESYGVRKELFDQDWCNGKYKYSVHSPMDMDFNKRYPLLYCSHGGNGTPFEAETIGFSKLIKSEQFIAVYPFNGGYSNEEAVKEFERIIGELIKKNYPIDLAKVYVYGYSSGSDASESIATMWPELVAAVAPCPGSNAMYNSLCRKTSLSYEKCLRYQVPMVCVGGTMDFGDCYPFPDEECYENFNIWAGKIARVHDYKNMSLSQAKTLIGSTTDASKKVVGLNFDHTWIETWEGRSWYFGDFYDVNQQPVIRFILGDGIPHITSGIHATLVYDWLRKWSRDPVHKNLLYKP